jgi:serine/threonine protein kinase
MEYCNGGSLKQFMTDRESNFTELEAKEVMRQLLNGLSAL